ncbi:sugar ABC transporter permease [Pseudoclavibacter sp. RFBJ3]|uniref:carbohydrate ABC transporter permease n=1 Tax=unclassified Pseudoclavibacter TaxID=2615177 RepID=UPI000CE85BE3|nr:MULTISPECIES: sugar ABC transporter permease [unclassified Pseudoclavibacter]MBF4552423.1 sugar ABC transporter permease [Pseudoclavibacter sp. VKM Ac-2888]PPF74618.1 sugar ABC transporter permease [Pseudoclavibacter sp. Z016]PPF82659.1 sugar ABC transporter permease [Pseudoclavibacter sp. RFBJ5]PPF91553.1 sugar ABC transporter permease [Pseudoclavibacter sp. RFBJ3]PPF96476.1 sugar ABC transporter permease [Pseudoclavibacter sp. RFBH5]
MLPLRSRLSVLVFLLPPLLLYSAAVLLPIVQSLILSFYRWDGITNMVFVGLDNYVKMFTRDDVFWTSFVNALGYLVICLVLQLGGALAVAGLLTAMPRARELVKTLYLLPAVISTVAIAFLFQRIYSLEPIGLINQLLEWFGLGAWQTAWLSNVQTVLLAVSIPEGWRFTGLYMLIIYAALIAVPKELEEAARLDGASWWQVFWRIRFPYIRPVWITTTIMATTFALRGFDIPYLLTNGGPGQSSELLTTYMYKTAFVHTDYGYASAISVFIVVECLVAVGLIFLLLRRRDAS